MKVFRYIVVILVMLSFTVDAQWYEATGQARIRHGDVASAKNRAIQDAIKQAMLFSGASISSLQEVSQGIVVDDRLRIQSTGSVNQVEIVDERRGGNYISITIRADIFAQDQECYASEFSKKLAITQFPIQHWQDAKIGSIYQLEKEVPRKILKMLQSGANGVYPVAWLDKKLNVNIDFEQQGKVRYQLIDAVSQDSNSQFVMFGRITDLSFGEQSNSFMFWQDDHFERYFTLEVMVANALTHEILYQNRFHTQAEWEYDDKEQLNVNGRRFWGGDYGHSIERLLKDVRNDIYASLSCQELQSKITAVRDGEQIQMNIGRGQGVEVGQEYRVSYRADVVDDKGNLLTNFVISPYRVRITQVYENSAIAESMDSDFMSNVQVNDIIELKDWDNSW